jgi:8-oxo-dGTP diphosphatase/2-hydroxy-dATP diphosphatase
MILTLGCIIKDKQILLGMKKRGFGAGRWNGFGGKLKDGESIESALVRETKEECDLEIVEHEKVGIIEFEFEKNPEILEVHIFKIIKFTGKPKETNEMLPRWYNFDKIPYNIMWPDDKFWLPLLIENKIFKGKFIFDKEGKIIKSQELKIVNKL